MFISYAWRIVKEHDDAVMALSKPALRGVIRFGSPEPYTTGVLPRLLARFASSYPEVRLRCAVKIVIRSKERLTRASLILGFVPRSIRGNGKLSWRQASFLPIRLSGFSCIVFKKFLSTAWKAYDQTRHSPASRD